MAGDTAKPCELDQEKYDVEDSMNIIFLGDSAVSQLEVCPGKVTGEQGTQMAPEWALVQLSGAGNRDLRPQQLSTYALTLYKHTATVDGRTVLVDFWDTAGQERFRSMHASYYHKAHACIMNTAFQRAPAAREQCHNRTQLSRGKIQDGEKIRVSLCPLGPAPELPGSVHRPYYPLSTKALEI
ncbi:rab-like protein 2B [Glossophaga mutica]